MNKLQTLLLAGAVALSFASCQKNANNGVEPNNGTATTFASITAQEASLRAVTDGQNDANGINGESLVSGGTFYVADANRPLTGSTIASLTFDPVATGAETYWQTGAFKYDGVTGANLRSALVLNGLTPASAFAATTEVTLADLSNLTKTTGFTMSSTSNGQIEIKQDVSETDAAAGKNNQFDYQVERVVAKLQVTQGAAFNESLKGELSGLRYALAGAATKSYLFLDNAGTRQLDVNDPTVGYGANFKSAIHANAASTYNAEGKFETRRADLTKVSDAQNVVAVGADGEWAAKHSIALANGNAAGFSNTSDDEGIYFFENSLDFAPSADNSFKYGDITYVKVYGIYTPAADEVAKLNNEGNALVVATPEEVATERGTEEAPIEAGSFYYGMQTRKLYLNNEAAQFDGNTETKMYAGGRMVWYTPANKQADAADASTTVYVNTRRNNIYSLSVDAINAFGDNWDPIDPTDPNIPQPENPLEPEKPEEEQEVDTHSTAISVRAAILKWNVVSRSVEFN